MPPRCINKVAADKFKFLFQVKLKSLMDADGKHNSLLSGLCTLKWLLPKFQFLQTPEYG